MIIDETVKEECFQVIKSKGRSVEASPVVAAHSSLCLSYIVANMMLWLYRVLHPLFCNFLA